MKRFLLLLLSVQMVYCSLPSLQKHAASLPEVPEISYDTFELHPDYSLWHREHRPSWIVRMVSSIGLYEPVWSPRTFIKELDQITAQRRGLTKHALVINPLPETEFVIVGPLFGAYHSLVRILTELKQQQMLNDQLQLTKKESYLVFTGDAINGSPYNLETLSLLLKLMLINPGRVIYLAGIQETDDTWRGFSFKNEIEERSNSVGLADRVSAFFETLPRALFITDSDDLLLIGNNVPLDCALEKLPPGVMNVCSVTEAKEATRSISAVITNEKRLISYAYHDGLVLAPAQYGALTWAIFSAPNSVFRKFYDFSYDAFALLTIGTSLSRSVISLFNQDVSQKSGFEKVGRFEVLSGKDLKGKELVAKNPFFPSADLQQKLATCKQQADLSFVPKDMAVEREPLYIGCTLDLTKGAAPLGRRLRDGITLRVNEINQAGGINGRPVQVVFMDDGYSPAQARKNVESFMKNYQSSLFLGNLGSPTTARYADLMKDQKIFVFFPSTGAPLFRQSSMKGVVHWRASFPAEGKALTHFMKARYGVADFGFLYQDDSFGRGALEGARQVDSKGIAAAYERNVISFDQQIRKIKEAGVEGVGFFSTSAAAIEFIRQAGVEFFIGKRLFGLSDLAEESFSKFAASRGLDFTIAQFVPNPETSKLAIAQEFRNLLRKQGGLVGDVFMFEGYISASLAFFILEQTKEYTPEAINKLLETIKQEDYKGFALSFVPNTRELAHLLWIDTGDVNWIPQEIA